MSYKRSQGQSLPFGWYKYDDLISRSVSENLTASQIAAQFNVEAGHIRSRAATLGFKLCRSCRTHWHAQAEQLFDAGTPIAAIAEKFDRSIWAIRHHLIKVGKIASAGQFKSPRMPKAAEIITASQEGEPGFWQLKSKMPWPKSILRTPVEVPKESRVPCLLLACSVRVRGKAIGGVVIGEFDDIFDALEAQKTTIGASQVARAKDLMVMSEKSDRGEPGKAFRVECFY